MSRRSPSGLMHRIMIPTPRLNVTNPMKGWRTSMAKCSPYFWPAQKMRVIRPRFMVQSKSIPPTNHSALRRNGPRTTKRKAVPTSRKPTTLLTPEQAETTLRLNSPAVMVNGEHSPAETSIQHRQMSDIDDPVHAEQCGRGKRIENSQQHGGPRPCPGQKKEPDGPLLAPQHSHAEDDGDRSGHEEWQREEIHPPHPEQGRPFCGKEPLMSRATTMSGMPMM